MKRVIASCGRVPQKKEKRNRIVYQLNTVLNSLIKGQSLRFNISKSS